MEAHQDGELNTALLRARMVWYDHSPRMLRIEILSPSRPRKGVQWIPQPPSTTTDLCLYFFSPSAATQCRACGRYKDQCSRLQSEKDALHSSAGEESTNLRDIIEYLGRELSARELEVSELKSLQATLEARLKDSQSEAQVLDYPTL